MKRFLKAAAAACAVSVLVACGGGGGTAASIPVAADVAAIELNADGSLVVAETIATSGQVLTFANGLPELGLGGPGVAATLEFGPGGTTFVAKSGADEVRGDVAFGSIIFTPRSTSPGFVLPMGVVLDMPLPELDFIIDLNTSGVLGNGTSDSVPMTITIGTRSSTPIEISIVISSNGAIQIDGETVGSVTFSSTTGGS